MSSWPATHRPCAAPPPAAAALAHGDLQAVLRLLDARFATSPPSATAARPAAAPSRMRGRCSLQPRPQRGSHQGADGVEQRAEREDVRLHEHDADALARHRALRRTRGSGEHRHRAELARLHLQGAGQRHHAGPTACQASDGRGARRTRVRRNNLSGSRIFRAAHTRARRRCNR